MLIGFCLREILLLKNLTIKGFRKRLYWNYESIIIIKDKIVKKISTYINAYFFLFRYIIHFN